MDDKRLYENESHEEGYTVCVRIQDRLPDLLEGCLDAMTTQAIRAHLSVCYFCSRIYGEMERTLSLVDSMPLVDPMKDFGPSIMSAIQGKRENPLKRAWMRFRPNRE
jgi:hypothetical protein